MLKMESRLVKVISGGQTGADQGALVAAKAFGLLTGGWAPYGWRTQDGPNLLLKSFGLKEHVDPDYGGRTEANVKEADFTLGIAINPSSPGMTLTKSLCKKHDKPYFCIHILPAYTSDDQLAELELQLGEAVRSIALMQPRVLNVAGNRNPEGSTIMFDATVELLAVILTELDGLDLVRRDTDL